MVEIAVMACYMFTAYLDMSIFVVVPLKAAGILLTVSV